MQKDFLLEVSGLTYSIASRTILKAVSFQLVPGQIVGLVGINGAGKSSTLNLIGGLLKPQAGQIRLNGVNLEAQPLIRQRQLGFLPDPLPFYPELSVEEHLIFHTELRCLDPERIPHRLCTVIQCLALGDFLQQKVASLSKGQRQRLGLAQALLHGPKWLLLDEPTQGLDPLQKSNFLSWLTQLKAFMGILIASHDLAEVQRICDRLLFLQQGKISEHSPEQARTLFISA